MTTETKTPPRKPPLPLELRLLGATVPWLGRIAPAVAARWVRRIWFMTRPFPPAAGEVRLMAGARRSRLDYQGIPLAVYEWGVSGDPVVMLVHGWNGRGAQLAAFAVPLVRAGYRVVAFDAPGHGDTPGRRTDAFEFTGALEAVAADCGPVHGVIAHSFGVIGLTTALSQGLPVQRAVCIGAPARFGDLVTDFIARLQVPPSTEAVFRRLLERRFGPGLWEALSPQHNARGLDTRVLVVHDRQDRVVPWRSAEEIAAAWPRARLFLTEGLGHQRILRSGDVVKAVTAFIASSTD